MARGLKFRIWVVEGLYYPYIENKGADQLRSYCAADLRLCFRICKKPFFSPRGSDEPRHRGILSQGILTKLVLIRPRLARHWQCLFSDSRGTILSRRRIIKSLDRLSGYSHRYKQDFLWRSFKLIIKSYHYRTLL